MSAKINPPTEESRELKFQKAWLSPSGGLHYLDGFIHEQWARLALGLDVAAPMPQEGGVDAKQKLFDAGWVRVALQSPDTFVIEYGGNVFLTPIQSARLIELATGAGAKNLVRDDKGRMQLIWKRAHV
jgi:hypothetical protein